VFLPLFVYLFIPGHISSVKTIILIDMTREAFIKGIVWYVAYRRENKKYFGEKQNLEHLVSSMKLEDRVQYQVDYNAVLKDK